ncbi:hypothetical protein ACFWNK_21910 [Streptomyces sp. NPDC058417]|uniref:hypothetical protein n=1 Tax=unclassified Streptomyces TaxID=2593676 RepID=UPI00365AAF10
MLALSVTGGLAATAGPSTSYASKGLLYKGDWGKKVSAKAAWIKLQLSQKARIRLAKNATGRVAKKYAYDCVPLQLDCSPRAVACTGACRATRTSAGRRHP